jgi:ribonuclease Y
VAAVAFVVSRRPGSSVAAPTAVAQPPSAATESQLIDQERKQILLAAQEEALRIRAEADNEVREQRAAVARAEQRNAQREDSLERRRREIDTGEQKLQRRELELTELQAGIESERATIQTELERVASLSQDQARAELLGKVEVELAGDIAQRIRDADVRVREEVGERSREILITAMQRVASDQTGESSVTVLHLPSDELKGRIIGREGRNIRTLEAATGVDVIVDETPETIVISAFDPVRREVARVTLERLFADGRIHPARIEEMVSKTRDEITQRIREEGESACQEFSLTGLHSELHTLLGALRFRNSYGHNVLSHSREVAALCVMLAGEIGYDEATAAEIGLMHDIGKAAAHEADGSHAIVGAEILSRLGRPAAVVEAVRAHHYDDEPKSVGAFLLMTADAISASRKGSRREELSSAIKRLERLEEIAGSFNGVERAFAVQAGKEIRVMVRPSEVTDDKAHILARDIARRLHGEGSYTGKLKVVVLRETRSVEYAK